MYTSVFTDEFFLNRLITEHFLRHKPATAGFVKFIEYEQDKDLIILDYVMFEFNGSLPLKCQLFST